MKQIFQTHPNRLLLCLLFTLIGGGNFVWGQSDYSETYTSNVTLSTSGGTSASACTVKIQKDMVTTGYDGIKAGTGSKTGAMKIAVPSGTKYLHIHAAAWKGESVSLNVNPNTGVTPNVITLTSDEEVSGNGPSYTLKSFDKAPTDYYKVITFANALESETTFTFTATGGNRFVIWGVNSEEETVAVDLESFSFANSAPSVTLSKNGSTYEAKYTQTVTAAPATYDGTVTYAIDESASTIGENTLAEVSTSGVVTIVSDANETSTIVVKASGEATSKYNAPADASYTLTVNAAPAGVGTPTFSLASGSYYYGTTTTISALNSSEIYYTTDGTTPSKSSTLYSDNVAITKTMTLKAIGYDGETASEVASIDYTLKAPEVPKISVASGEVDAGTTVTLTPGEGGDFVAYTTDGSDPTAESELYTEPIAITRAMTLKAATKDKGNNLSSIASATYTIKAQNTNVVAYFNNTVFGVSTGSNAKEQTYKEDGVTVVAGCTSSASSKTYYDSGHVRFYANSYLKLTAPSGYNIVKVVFTANGTWNGGISVDNGSYDNSDKTWTGATNQLDFSFNAQNRIASAAITLEAPKTLTSITLSGTYPITFHQGDKFSSDGIVVTAHYDDATEKEVTGAIFSGYDMSTTGSQTVTVSYTENEVTKTATYDITVKAPATLASISLSGEYPTDFTKGDEFSSDGIVVTAHYDDETEKEVTGATFSGYDMSTTGSQTVTVSYTENEVTKTATYDITVNAPQTWSLASSITSGKHYIIVNKESSMAMGTQNSNNRAAVDVTIEGETLTASSGVQEFVIYGPDADGYYTIYDAVENGYLYAASSSSNYLKTEKTVDDNACWKITFSDGVASIVAQGTYTRNVMQYNKSNTLFACYGSASQNPISLYEKDGEATPTESVTVTKAGYATYCSENALDFTDTGITAYYGTAEGSKLTFKPITKVPANTGVLLVCAGGKIVDVPALSGAADEVTGNILKGVTTATTIDAEDYILNVKEIDGEKKAGFFLAGNDHKNLAANRAYIPATKVADVKSFVLDLEDNADGIEETLSDSLLKSENIYNLAGQRLSKMQKGINIVNGKKILK